MPNLQTKSCLLENWDVLDLDVLKILASENNTEPYWFGLGFIQLKLSKNERMHFWWPHIPRKEREEIHNHRYDFESTVLAGTLCHDTYTIKQFAMGGVEYEVYETNCMPGKEGTVQTTIPCQIYPAGSYDLDRGSHYKFPHTMFHSTERTTSAITYLIRAPKALEFASVVKEAGAPTSCPFADKIPTAECWEYISSALALAKMQRTWR